MSLKSPRQRYKREGIVVRAPLDVSHLAAKTTQNILPHKAHSRESGGNNLGRGHTQEDSHLSQFPMGGNL